MKKHFNIFIPKPCNENWDAMTPNEQGRHCDVCTKTVVDFTRKTDREIAKLVASGDALCGRFKKEQLDRPIPLPRKRDAFFELIPPSYAASLFIPVALFGTQHLEAQETSKHPIVQVSSHPSTQLQTKGKIAITPSAATNHTLKGIITDGHNPLAGVHIIVKDSNRTTQTAADGTYEIQVKEGEIMVISFAGYHSQKVIVDVSQSKQRNFVLESDNELMGDVMILGEIAYPQVSHKEPISTPRKSSQYR